MPAPSENGALIYAMDIQKLADFYQTLFEMKVLRVSSKFISLDKNGFNLIIHRPPFALPDERSNTVKLFLSVENMQVTRERAISLGGSVFDGEWANPVFKVSNIADSDGNHIQIREFTDKR